MARTAGKDPAVMKTKKTPRGRQKKARSSGRLGQGSEQEWNVRPDKAQPNGARKTKKSRRSHSEWSDDAGVFDMRDSDDDWLPSMDGKQRESGAATPAATSAYRTRPAVKRARNDSTGGGGSQEVSAPATDDEACQPPTMSAAVTRKRKSEGGGGTSGDGTGGGRQRRNRTKRGAAAPSPAAAAAAATTASTTGSTTSSGPSRRSSRTTSGGGSTGGGSTGGGGTGISPPASTTITSPSSTASPGDIPVAREDVMRQIRGELTPQQRKLWDETTQRPSWTPRQRTVKPKDTKDQADISKLKKTVTGRKAPENAAGVGNVVFKNGVLWDILTCKILAFPVNDQHFMGGPDEYKGKNAAVVWRNVVYWLGENGKLLDGQCCTAHYLGQVMQRCGLENVFVCDASGVAHPRAGSGLKKDHAGTHQLVTAHVEYLLRSGRRMFEVHSRGTTLRFIAVLEKMATEGHADVSIKIGSGNVRVHVFFGVPCGPDGKLDTVVLFGTNHHSMMRWSFVANSIIRSQIAASALAGNALTKGQVDDLWAMSTTGSLSPEEWKEYFAVLVEELGEELLAKFEFYVTTHDGDMDRAYQSLNGWRGGMAAPTTKAKRGGEWETAENVGCQEVERLKKKRSTRLNSKLMATEKKGLAIVRDNLYQQHCRWERSVGALHFGDATNYATYLEAKKTSQDENATLAQQEEASAVVSTMEKEKRERLSARGNASIAKRKEDPEKFRQECADGATADLRPETIAHPAHQRTVAKGKTPSRSNVNKTAEERGSTKSTNEGKADGGRIGGEASIKKRRRDSQKFKDDCAAGGKAKQGRKISSSGGKRGGGGAARKGNPVISSVRTRIGFHRRAYVTTTGKVKIGGKSTFYHYRDVRTPGSQKRILGLIQHDSHGSDKTLSYPVDDNGEMVTGVWGADPTLGLYNEYLVRYARQYVVTETTTAAASAES